MLGSRFSPGAGAAENRVCAVAGATQKAYNRGVPPLALRRIRIDVGGRPLLTEVDLEVAPGEMIALTGRSGAGKTTLLRVIAALADPAAGELSLRDRSPGEIGWPAWRRRVTYVAQEPIVFEATVRQNLARPFAYGTATRAFAEAEDEIRGWLERLGLGGAERLDQDARTLSVGERQRVALVRALAIAPEVLLLDEPTSALDGAATTAVEELVTGWVAAGERAALVVTHDQEQARRWCDRQVDLSRFAAGDAGV
jgi:putative ABC transport system ATP-binding protein